MNDESFGDKRGTGFPEVETSAGGQSRQILQPQPCGPVFRSVLTGPWGRGLLADTQVCLVPVSLPLLGARFWL